MTDLSSTGRRLPDRLDNPLKSAALSWESLLVLVALAIFLANSFASPYFLNPWSLSDLTFNFTEKALIALAMALVIITGEIDLSVASIIALASTLMGLALQAGADTPMLVAVGIGVGILCGAFNGFLVTGLKLPSIVVTIGTMSLFRGIAFIILGDQSFKGYPKSFSWFGQGYVWWVISFELVLFLVCAAIFYVLLHHTNFGRRVYAIGNNPAAALFSGVRVDRIKFVLFCLTGLMSGVAAVLLTARLGSTRPSIAQGFELEVITMVVLGGVSILGGSGSIIGVVLAALIMGLVTFGLGLLNVPGIVMSIFIGALLIVVITLGKAGVNPFKGRISRRQFWVGFAQVFLGFLIIEFLYLLTGWLAIPFIGALVSMYFLTSLFSRRWHDIGKSAWWGVSCFIPIVGIIYNLYCLGINEGDEGENAFGPEVDSKIWRWD